MLRDQQARVHDDRLFQLAAQIQERVDRSLQETWQDLQQF